MTRIIGITGGIGSGKSTLAACFTQFGIPVFDADAIARNALSPESDCFAKAIELFGSQALREDGSANRAYIADRVFHDRELLNSLNAIIHPHVIRTMLKQTELCGAPLAVWDVPLLFESGCDALCACTIAVVCDEDIRIKRVMQRDGVTEEQVRVRIAEQSSDAFKRESATYTISNDGDEEAFRKEAAALIESIRKDLM